ncbi:MAG TPA: ACT domain-containing protein [Candidatus Paceibacterota bacterium]|nr:ACT domain-containing protein [Candidatus Paceibacterota bacterium]
MMNVPLVMTVIGRDRPGLVGLLADVVGAHDGNWLESRMCHLGGEFAGILRVHVPQDQESSLVQNLKALEKQGLSCQIRPDPSAQPPAATPSTILEIVGQDRPGIIRQISSALSRHGINVEELTSECGSAPMTGEILFRATIKLHIPESCPMAPLREELEKIAADLMVDVQIAPAP